MAGPSDQDGQPAPPAGDRGGDYRRGQGALAAGDQDGEYRDGQAALAAGDQGREYRDGQAALAAGDWKAAEQLFQAALARDDTPEHRLGLGQALWWLGDFAGSVAHREHAYRQLRQRGDDSTAAMVAVWLSIGYKASWGHIPAARGWAARAERALAGVDGAPQGWLSLARATFAAQDQAERLAAHALEVARRTGDIDLELCALGQVGALTVARGGIDAGLAMLEEAMVAALAGEAEDLTTVIFTSCLMLVACAQCADLERAIQWCRSADRFLDRYGAPYLFAWCRTAYGAVLRCLGRWDEAEREFTQAIAASRGVYHPVHAQAAASLAELRVMQGDLAAAAGLLDGIDAAPEAALAVARLHLARHQAPVAVSTLRRRLDQVGDDVLVAGPLLGLLVEAHVACGQLLDAEELAERLSALAALSGRTTDDARAHMAHGRVAAAQDDHDKAQRHFQAAMDAFARVGIPRGLARARVALAASLGGDHPAAALVEARAGLATLTAIGAKPDADHAAALVRRLGGRPPTGPRTGKTLTRRQSEVLALVAEGLSNPEIASRLHLSRRTVEHHVEHVLARLGVRGRTEAAAVLLTSPPDEIGGVHPRLG